MVQSVPNCRVMLGNQNRIISLLSAKLIEHRTKHEQATLSKLKGGLNCLPVFMPMLKWAFVMQRALMSYITTADHWPTRPPVCSNTLYNI